MQNQDIEEYEDRDIDPGLLRHIVVNLAEYKKKNNLLIFIQNALGVFNFTNL